MARIGLAEMMILFVAGLAVPALVLVAMWRIFARTGMSGGLSLLMLIPVVNIIMFFVLAFGEWPIEKELHQWRAWYEAQQNRSQ